MNHLQLGELVESNPKTLSPDQLGARLEEDGYLFIRKLFDAEQVQHLRGEIVSVLQKGGWLTANSDPMDAVANIDDRCTEGDLAYTDVYHKVYKLEAFHAFAHNRAILDLLESIRKCPMMPQPQNVCRLWFPKFTEHTTPSHQDFVHFQGSFENLTCWSPVGDCPQELGGLAVLPNSHKVDRVLDHHFSLGAGSLSVDSASKEMGETWLTTDYEIGDALIFPFLTIHKALPNTTPDRLRISLDNRYQRIGDPIAEHMLNPHLSSMSPLSWDDVYRGWNSDRFQYYWKNHNNPVLSKITKYLDSAFDEAAELARNGEPDGILHLQRIAARDKHSEQGTQAIEILKQLDLK